MKSQRKKKPFIQTILKERDKLYLFASNCIWDTLLARYRCQRWKICIVLNAMRFFGLRNIFLNLIIWLIFPFFLSIMKWKFYIPMKHTQLFSFLILVHMVWQAWIQNIFSWVRVNAWSLLWACGSIFYCSFIYKYFLSIY